MGKVELTGGINRIRFTSRGIYRIRDIRLKGYKQVTCIFHAFPGKYIFIETSSPRVKGDRAVLESDMIDKTTGKCFSFWYHMYGRSIGALKIYIRDISGNKRSVVSIRHLVPGLLLSIRLASVIIVVEYFV